MDASNPLPASLTKHLGSINHPIPRSNEVTLSLNQISSQGGGSTGTTGTTLWLSSQILSCYLSTLLPPTSISSGASGSNGATPANEGGKRRKVLDLGSGIGYLPICLAYWGCDVLATDIEPVLSTVLQPNIDSNARHLNQHNGSGSISAKSLDWEKAPLNPTTLDDHMYGDYDDFELCEVDWIVTADTIYHPSLLPHLFRSIIHISNMVEKKSGKSPSIWLALERRDPRLVDSALEMAKEMDIDLKRIGHGRVVKAVEKVNWGWKEADWEGVEIYKGKYKGTPFVRDQA